MINLDAVVYQPMFGEGGRLIGVRLEPNFARLCSQCLLDEFGLAKAHAYVWRRVKPTSWKVAHHPNEMLTMQEGSLLVQTVHLHHGGHSGKWLTADFRLYDPKDTSDQQSVEYDFHHSGDMLDDAANRLLLWMFDHWSMFAKLQLEQS